MPLLNATDQPRHHGESNVELDFDKQGPDDHDRSCCPKRDRDRISQEERVPDRGGDERCNEVCRQDPSRPPDRVSDEVHRNPGIPRADERGVQKVAGEREEDQDAGVEPEGRRMQTRQLDVMDKHHQRCDAAERVETVQVAHEDLGMLRSLSKTAR